MGTIHRAASMAGALLLLSCMSNSNPGSTVSTTPGGTNPVAAQPKCPKGAVQTDISYNNPPSSPGGIAAFYAERRFDFYPTCPQNGVIVFVHGGGWQRGDKTEMPAGGPIFDALRDKGYNVISTNYRLSTGSYKWPAQINDIKCLLEFLAVHKDVYGDTQNLQLWGHSAGAHLVMMAALTDASELTGECAFVSAAGSPNYKIVRAAGTSAPVDLVNGLTTKSLGPTGNLFGVVLATTNSTVALSERTAASPVNYASSGDPPVLLITGELDDLAPPTTNSKVLRDNLVAAGAQAEWIDITGGTHNNVYSYPVTTAEITSFLAP